MKNRSGEANPVAVLVFAIVLVAIALFINISLGIGAWGPERTTEVTVNRTYVDVSGSGDNRASHYMIATDKGIFEADNSFIMGIWNADELYGSVTNGGSYVFVTKGNKCVNFFLQKYPYLKDVRPLSH